MLCQDALTGSCAGRLLEPVAANARGLTKTTEPAWIKSSYSSGGDCVEAAVRPSTIPIRDSKNTAGPHLTLSPAAWAGLVTYAGK
ncbi:DUF397 domain-containing protein [Streptomyces sp. NPDC059224]|uniref:DUF397 domain-containing protein n=1 Tax=Streptomyces sp. NPDC059224 TaxID=3346775 RepID=UPI0036B51BF3